MTWKKVKQYDIIPVNIKTNLIQIKTLSEIGSGDELFFALQYCYNEEDRMYFFRGEVSVKFTDPMSTTVWKYDCVAKIQHQVPIITERAKIWTFTWKGSEMKLNANGVEIFHIRPHCSANVNWNFTHIFFDRKATSVSYRQIAIGGKFLCNLVVRCYQS